MRILLIGNPISGGGRARPKIERLGRALEARGHSVETFLTGKAGDGAARAARLEPDFEALVVAGGDGTLNEVLQGLEDPSRIPLCQLASGTANILARELGLPFEPEALAEVIHARRIRRADLGTIGSKRFLMVVSAGFDAEVTAELSRTRKGPLGFLGYVAPVARVLQGYRPPSLRVRVDGKGGYRGAWVVISNTRNYGGLFTLADSAAIDSGTLEVLLFSRAGALDLLGIGLAGLSGEGVSRLPGVTRLTGREIVLEAEGEVDIEVDGDHWGVTPATIQLTPGVVPLLVPS